MSETLRVPVPSLEEFLVNDNNVKPDDRTRYILGICIGEVVSDLNMDSLKVEPFFNRKDLRPTRKHFILELKRRSPILKNLTNMSVQNLIEMLTKTKEDLSDLDVEYLTTKYNDLVNV